MFIVRSVMIMDNPILYVFHVWGGKKGWFFLGDSPKYILVVQNGRG